MIGATSSYSRTALLFLSFFFFLNFTQINNCAERQCVLSYRLRRSAPASARPGHAGRASGRRRAAAAPRRQCVPRSRRLRAGPRACPIVRPAVNRLARLQSGKRHSDQPANQRPANVLNDAINGSVGFDRKNSLKFACSFLNAIYFVDKKARTCTTEHSLYPGN